MTEQDSDRRTTPSSLDYRFGLLAGALQVAVLLLTDDAQYVALVERLKSILRDAGVKP